MTEHLCIECRRPIFKTATRCKACSNWHNAQVSREQALPLRPMPADFAERAATASNTQLRAHYKVRWAEIHRWREESGVPSPRRQTVYPDGFEAAARVADDEALASRYSVSRTTVGRWRRSLKLPVVHRVTVRPHGPHVKTIAVARVAKADSRAAMAAEHLRHLGPVFRCDDAGRADPKGQFWNRGGRTVLTDDELIERAVRNGWRPDAWREVVAA